MYSSKKKQLVWREKPRPPKLIFLPDEIIMEEIIMNSSDTPNFMSICQSNKKFVNICNNDDFWRRLYEKYYADTDIDLDVEFDSFFDLFKFAFSLDNVLIAFKDQGEVGIRKLHSLKKIKLTNRTDSIHKIESIPYGIGYLENLFKLNLENNDISYISPQIGKLVNLEILNLRGNRISSIPEELYNLTNLLKLDLSLNDITFISPKISNLIKLTELNLAANVLKYYPIEIYNLPKLITLNLRANFITLVPNPNKFVNLIELNLSNNKISKLPKNFNLFNKLKFLNLSFNKFYEFPNILLIMNNLRKVNLYESFNHPINQSIISKIPKHIYVNFYDGNYNYGDDEEEEDLEDLEEEEEEEDNDENYYEDYDEDYGEHEDYKY